MFTSISSFMGIRALEGGLPKYGKNLRIFFFGKGVFTGKMPTIRQQIFFHEEQIFKQKLHTQERKKERKIQRKERKEKKSLVYFDERNALQSISTVIF